MGPALAVATLLAPRLGRAQDDRAALAVPRYQRGVALFDQARYADALVEFRAAMAVYPSPNSRLYAARALRELGRLGEAARELEATAREAADRARTDPRYEPTRDAARTELAALVPRVGWLTVTAASLPAHVRVRFDGTDVPPAALGAPLAVTPGTVTVVAEASGFVGTVRRVPLAAGGAAVTRVGFVALPDPRVVGAVRARADGLQWSGVAAGALGVVGGAGLITFAALGAAQFAALSASCGGLPVCPSDMQDAIARGEAWQVLANVSLGVALSGAVVAAVLVLASRGVRASEPRVRTVSDGHGGLEPMGVRW